jgi:hypothetical protein
MVRVVEFGLAIVFIIFAIIKLWPILTNKTIGSKKVIDAKKKLAEAKENLTEEELLLELNKINKQIEEKRRVRNESNS